MPNQPKILGIAKRIEKSTQEDCLEALCREF